MDIVVHSILFFMEILLNPKIILLIIAKIRNYSHIFAAEGLSKSHLINLLLEFLKIKKIVRGWF